MRLNRYTCVLVGIHSPKATRQPLVLISRVVFVFAVIDDDACSGGDCRPSETEGCLRSAPSTVIAVRRAIQWRKAAHVGKRRTRRGVEADEEGTKVKGKSGPGRKGGETY